MAISPISAPASFAGEPSLQTSSARPTRETSSLLGSLNPLHHIPVVSTVYDHLTGTRAVPAIRILVGAALAGPVGFIAALADALCEETTGRTIGGHAVVALIGEPITAVAARDAGTSLGSPVSDAGAAVEDAWTASATSDHRGKPRANRTEPDMQTAREVARAYLLDLALRHPLKPMQSEDDGSSG